LRFASWFFAAGVHDFRQMRISILKRSEKYYLDFGGNRIVPESPFETDILRQAILADKWNLPHEQQSIRGARWPLLCSTGGQAVFHPEWSTSHIVHYTVGEHLDDGFFDLKVCIYGRRLLASFSLMAALVFKQKPWFQSGWQGQRRSVWVCPWWFLKEERANPVGLHLKFTQAKGALMIGSQTEATAEWDCLPPHALLVDPSTIAVK
jgi:hypothetical protein